MSLNGQIRKAVGEFPNLPDAVLARKIADEAGETALLAFAVERIERSVKGERRRRIREVEESLADDTDADPAVTSTIDALLEEFRKAVIVDWTEELLSSEFAVGDGTRVTWGEATVDQHLARMRMLTQNVRGNLDAIQRHEAAITTINERGASRLSEAVGS